MVVGVDAVPISVEATLRGAGAPRILGRVDPVVREAYHRILTAFSASGLGMPRGAPTINFAPAHLRKSGSGFDLPMALALAGAAGLLAPERTATVWALGELSLQGAILPTRGAVAVAIAAATQPGAELLANPRDAAAAALVPGVDVRPVATLRDALLWLRGEHELPPAAPAPLQNHPTGPDLADIRGHETPKQALAVAAAGRHNLLFVGPPGSGKSALLRRLPGLLVPPQPEEQLDILKIHTVHGSPAARVTARPVRAPHHSSSHVSLLGGGPEVRPGEVTLAHRGVLYLDELAEFRREALEGLRQPLEDGVMVVGRARGTVRMPAEFLLVAAMNPCPCGYLGHTTRPCVCGPAQQRRYRARVSGPLLDRLDLQVEVPALDPAELRAPAQPDGTTAALRARVAVAVARQQQRNLQHGRTVPNGQLHDAALEAVIGRDAAIYDALDEAMRAFHLSGRARVRLLRVARTLADLDDTERVTPTHILEAVRLRAVERSWHH
ncbi:MAG: YifB family Mg chelatase-like AAA ATPase [Planctomycetota bacterium]